MHMDWNCLGLLTTSARCTIANPQSNLDAREAWRGCNIFSGVSRPSLIRDEGQHGWNCTRTRWWAYRSHSPWSLVWDSAVRSLPGCTTEVILSPRSRTNGRFVVYPGRIHDSFCFVFLFFRNPASIYLCIVTAALYFWHFPHPSRPLPHPNGVELSHQLINSSRPQGLHERCIHQWLKFGRRIKGGLGWGHRQGCSLSSFFEGDRAWHLC